MWSVLLLSVTSSLDNFAVGAALGVTGRPLSYRLNAIISIANAAGAWGSAGFGHAVAIMGWGGLGGAAASLLASALFSYLGTQELKSFCRQEESSLLAVNKNEQKQEGQLAWKLALPMTLNNLAGGVAGGLGGATGLDMGIGAFVASFFLMALGHVVACQTHIYRRRSNISGNPTDPTNNGRSSIVDSRLAASSVFFFLAILQFVDGIQQISNNEVS
eukprot:scaffold23396_cov47-Attheya_sp.AAC.1